MDGTAKGGIAVAIQSELGVPVKYIGVGESIDDLQKFDSESFVNALFAVEPETWEEEELVIPTPVLPEEETEASEETTNIGETSIEETDGATTELTETPEAMEEDAAEETGLISLKDWEELARILSSASFGVGTEVWEACVTAVLDFEPEDPENFDWSPWCWDKENT